MRNKKNKDKTMEEVFNQLRIKENKARESREFNFDRWNKNHE